MIFDPFLALQRFGTGLSPRHAPPGGLDALLDDLRGPDAMAAAFPLPGFATAVPSHAVLVEANRRVRAAAGTATETAEAEARQVLREQIRAARLTGHLTVMARAVDSPLGLRERLVAFWADHFTVRRRALETAHLVTAFIEDAIRPHVMGRFSDMLRAVVTHPMMLLYLEQHRSIGPLSRVGRRQNKGLNENLARELLELHLVGVSGSYSQTDVRELAELLTGLSYSDRKGVYYDPQRAEPGAEQVLGLSFDPAPALETILAALDRLAVLPQTGQHLAQKMAVHFTADAPDPGLVAAMVAGFGPGGDLDAMTAAMLAHPAAWDQARQKVRPPQEFITAAMRALGVTGAALPGYERGLYNRVIGAPLRLMGQQWETPPGPDGWPEAAEDWIIPQTMAARISWAMQAPARIVPELPDPRDFVRTALGPDAPAEVVFAAGAAETFGDGVGIVLAAPGFQRR